MSTCSILVFLESHAPARHTVRLKKQRNRIPSSDCAIAKKSSGLALATLFTIQAISSAGKRSEHHRPRQASRNRSSFWRKAHTSCAYGPFKASSGCAATCLHLRVEGRNTSRTRARAGTKRTGLTGRNKRRHGQLPQLSFLGLWLDLLLLLGPLLLPAGHSQLAPPLHVWHDGRFPLYQLSRCVKNQVTKLGANANILQASRRTLPPTRPFTTPPSSAPSTPPVTTASPRPSSSTTSPLPSMASS